MMPLSLRFRLGLVCLVLFGCAAGCAKDPWYPPPPQRQPILIEDRPRAQIIGMGDPSADLYIVRDISDTVEGGSWRWTFERPELRFWLESTANLKLSVDFQCSGLTLEKTGPVTISFFVNNRPLGSTLCAKAGAYHFEKAVPASWLDTAAPTSVAAQADKVWTAPSDGKKLGFILIKAGFIS